MCCNRNNDKCLRDELLHVHEICGNVQLGGNRNCPHTHCFEAITSKGIPCGEFNHFHEVEFKTDITDCHCHKFCGKTGPAIQTCDGEHIHLLESVTSYNDGHRHCINVASTTEKPLRC